MTLSFLSPQSPAKGISPSFLTRSRRGRLLFLLAGTCAIYAYFVVATASRYEVCPLGDASDFTLMALHFDDPSAIHAPIPRLYASRPVPSILAGLLAAPSLGGAGRDISKPETLSTSGDAAVLKVDQVIRLSFVWLNLAATLATVYFLYLALEAAGLDRMLCVGLPLCFLTLFIPVRLYIRWPQMADPLGFAFLAGMFYFLLVGRFDAFILASIPAVLTRENVLFLLPSFWLKIWRSEGKRREKALWFLGSLAPTLLFLYWRKHSYFPAAAISPNAGAGRAPGDPASLGILSEYIQILQFEAVYALHKFRYVKIALLPFYVFGAFAFVLAAKRREAARILAANSYWLPFVLLAALAGFWADRHLFYLFPVVLLLAGHILNDAFAGERRRMGFFLASICAVHVFMYGHWRFVKGADPGYTASHQVEYMSVRSAFWAALKTLSAGAAVAMLL